MMSVHYLYMVSSLKYILKLTLIHLSLCNDLFIIASTCLLWLLPWLLCLLIVCFLKIFFNCFCHWLSLFINTAACGWAFERFHINAYLNYTLPCLCLCVLVSRPAKSPLKVQNGVQEVDSPVKKVVKRSRQILDSDDDDDAPVVKEVATKRQGDKEAGKTEKVNGICLFLNRTSESLSVTKPNSDIIAKKNKTDSFMGCRCHRKTKQAYFDIVNVWC